MKKQTPISQIMSTDIITVQKHQNLKEVNKIIKDKHIRHVPVLSEGRVIGIMSKTDLQKISFINTLDGEGLTDAIYNELTVDQVMTRDLTTVQTTDSIQNVALLLAKKEFHALPVLEDKKLVGIVTTTDLINYMVSILE